MPAKPLECWQPRQTACMRSWLQSQYIRDASTHKAHTQSLVLECWLSAYTKRAPRLQGQFMHALAMRVRAVQACTHQHFAPSDAVSSQSCRTGGCSSLVVWHAAVSFFRTPIRLSMAVGILSAGTDFQSMPVVLHPTVQVDDCAFMLHITAAQRA